MLVRRRVCSIASLRHLCSNYSSSSNSSSKRIATHPVSQPLRTTQLVTRLHTKAAAASMSSPAPSSMSASPSPASSSGASSTPAPSLSPAAQSHAALDFFDSHPSSFLNLVRGADRSWLDTGRAQLTAALGLDTVGKDKAEMVAQMAALEEDPLALESLLSSAASASSGWLPSPEQEQAEIADFIRWASGPAQKLVRQVVDELPRGVYANEDEASADSDVVDVVGRLVARAEMMDFSPAGRIDDDIFAKHRVVWERITRGCAVLRLTPSASAPAGSKPILRWAVRANRKFTGFEDDVRVDGALYTVSNEAGPADRVVVTHKCNGSVLHLAARDILLWGCEHPTRFVFLGSKKVHVGAVWAHPARGGAGAEAGAVTAKRWAERMALYRAERHQVVGEMLQFVSPRLGDEERSSRMLGLLAGARLVINAEYVSSIGTGPTDNERIYGLAPAAREAFGFMLSVSALSPPRALALGVEPLYGLWLLRQWGFATVAAFTVPLDQLAENKQRITSLPDVEGAVLYYSNRLGLLQLEKWKSSGYVIVRAVREKLRPFIYGNKQGPGLDTLLQAVSAHGAGAGVPALRVEKKSWSEGQLEEEKKRAMEPEKNKSGKKKRKQKENAASSAAASIESLSLDSEGSDGGAVAVAPAPASSSSSPAQTYLEFSHPQLDAAGSALTALGLRKVPTPTPAQQPSAAAAAQQQCTWRVACPASPAGETSLRATVDAAYSLAVLQRPVAVALSRVTEKVAGRIRAIDHIPLTAEERAQWLEDSAAFLQWLTAQLTVHRRWAPKEVMNQYSKLWTLFRDERAALGAIEARVEQKKSDQPATLPSQLTAAAASASSSS